MQATPPHRRRETTTRRSASCRPVTFAALRSAASTTIAVAVLVVVHDRDVQLLLEPGLDLEAARRADVLRLMPPNEGAMASTVATISSTSVVESTIGTESSSANSRNRQALPSITGSAAAGPMSPRPSTAVPSDTTATTRGAQVKRRASSGLGGDGAGHPATPGV